MESFDNKARKIQEIATKLGWDSDFKLLIERVKQIDKGLSYEDEFIYLLNWLPNCIIVNKIDQSTMPKSHLTALNVSDLLAVFEIDGEKKSFLIEVKTSIKSKLSWSEKYVKKLKSYSRMLGLPVLVAWKCTTYSFTDWILVSLDDFLKPHLNYKLEYTMALKKNLLSQYARDYYVVLDENFSIKLIFKKVEKIDFESDSETWDVFLEQIKIVGQEEQEIDKLSIGLFALLLCIGINEEIEVTETHLIHIWKPFNSLIPIHRVPLFLNKINSKQEISWLELIQAEKYPIEYNRLFDDLKKAIDEGLLKNILFTVPNDEE
jgi:Holliday junction resolvase